MKATIPVAALKDFSVKPLICLTFQVENPVSPANLGLSGDKRLLGLGVQKLMIQKQ